MLNLCCLLLLLLSHFSCVRLWDPIDSSPPGSSIHGILQARILEWVSISFSRGSSRLRDQTQVSCIAGRRFNLWATREAPWMWELDCEEGWVPKNWCFWTVVLEKTLESPLDCKEIQPVHSKGNQPWDFFGRNDAKAESPVLLPGESHGQRSLVGYSPRGRKESDMTERLHFSCDYLESFPCWLYFLPLYVFLLS